MFLFYDLIFLIGFIFYLPVLILKGKWHRLFWMRFGFFEKTFLQLLKKQKNIWIHAVSVGEVIMISGLVRQIKKQFPDKRIVLSTVTKTGYEVALTKLKEADVVIYAPLDLSFVVKRYIDFIRPEVYIVAETEIWPNLLLELNQKNIPIVLVNGRISDQSFQRYQRLQWFFKQALSAVSLFCMQSKRDVERILALGVLDSKLKQVGNMKFDDHPFTSQIMPEDYGFQSGQVIWVAGSTHPGEEEIILRVFKKLKEEFPLLRLILVPRHIERSLSVKDLVVAEGYPAILFSAKGKESFSSESIMIMDQVGHLKFLYHFASIVFVGKSLTAQGGQNVIEPAFLGKPIVVGPNMQNFKDVMAAFLEAQAIIQVHNEGELLQEMQRLQRNPESAQLMGQRALGVIAHHQGATLRTLKLIAPFIQK